ncbi:LysM peptidoglycan-binding domain-containing protein [uncultured Polaribacter sp.]|uniref:LysM peptidoglycan-binding domain-containing protein n=1 Tax=uncultured Polaribacter sp. TaxID=174711 RepID=UPI002635D275|nr:LysM peptidoglycan-binding domain-containing protein [uncultured Polaribacter sp.]
MKKTIQFIILLIFNSITIFGQSKETKLADALFDDLLYAKAAKEYEFLLKKNETGHILKRLGDCYYNNVQMDKASKIYTKLFTSYVPQNLEYFFKYAQSLRAIGNFEESDLWLKKFHELNKKDSRGKNFTKSNVNLVSLTSGKPNYKVQNLNTINTEFADFGVTEYNNTILFSSPKNLNTSKSSIETGTEDNFLDIFQVQINEISYKKPNKKLFSKRINKKYNESSISFSPNFKTIYFTRNNYNKGVLNVDKKGYNNLKIYRADLIDNNWGNIIELPFCSSEYSVGHPTVSKDGKRLYFASDMPGSLGFTDIYYVKINSNGTYGTPVNLGPTINTEGREMFPFISANNTLYFSSDGHFGIGALDVFSSEIINNEFQKPKNLKAPLNSKLDDFAFSINTETNKGYLSSNRKGGLGNDDIYAIEKINVNTPCKQLISGIVKESKFNKILPNAKLVLKDDVGNTINETIADEFGKFNFTLPCNKKYTITASKEYYKPDTKSFETTNSVNLELILEIIDDFAYNNNNELVIKINSIYFDYTKWDIRPDAARELDHIIKVMRKYPLIKVKSTSHTDARGSYFSNELLSQRRAEATVDYIIFNGIDYDRISGKGYGETQLTNNCVDNDNHSNTVKCTEDQHQANRRTSFVIQNIDGSTIKSKEKEVVEVSIPIEINKENKKVTPQETKVKIVEPKKVSSAKLHIVQPQETLYSISKQHNISLVLLKEINQLSSSKISIGQVLSLNKEVTIENKIEAKKTHVVKYKETLYSISKKYNMSVANLKSLNSLKDNTISVGQILKIL